MPSVEQHVLDLQDSVVDMPQILEQVTPVHVHWLRKDQPWFLRVISSDFFVLEHPVIDYLVRLAYKSYFKFKGLAVEPECAGSTVIPVKPPLTASQRKALLFFREIDFIAGSSFNSTRIEGDRNMYHFFYPLTESLMKQRIKTALNKDWEAIDVFRQARML